MFGVLLFPLCTLQKGTMMDVGKISHRFHLPPVSKYSDHDYREGTGYAYVVVDLFNMFFVHTPYHMESR